MKIRQIILALMCTTPAACMWSQDLKPMPKDAHPVFEVVTIKPSDRTDQSQGFQLRGRHVKLRNESVTSMVMFAYGVHNKQIVDEPAWMKESFDADGVPDVIGEPSLKQMQELVQQLLADRFGLKFHREKRDLAVYAITTDKGGAKIQKSKSPDDQPPDQTGNGGDNLQKMKFTNNTMDDFALGMQYFMDKPVVNQTGLTGRFDFTLQWSTALGQPNDADAPGMFTAIKEQLGLKLEATRGSTDVLVIEKVERPSAN